VPLLPRRRLPGLNAEVSAIGAGCWTIGGPALNDGVPIGWDHPDPEPDAGYAGLVRAHELGVTLFDTADVYGLGRSERLLGRLLATVDRSSIVVSSKVGYFAGTGRHPYCPAQMRHQFTTTLDNLGTDHLDIYHLDIYHLDIYHLHSTDFGPDDRYLPDAIDVMTDLRGQGLIRAIGLRAPHTFAEQWASTDRPDAAPTARWLHLFHAIQPTALTVRYNLLSPLYPAQDTDIFTFAHRHGVGVLIKQALGQGTLLRTPHTPPASYSAADHRRRDPLFHPDALGALDARLAPRPCS
jgi:aryl-alcohol dehydrogenase-like predicted oxidoreductase